MNEVEILDIRKNDIMTTNRVFLPSQIDDMLELRCSWEITTQ